MSGWQDVGYDNLEFKITRRGQLMLREKGQADPKDPDYPHFMVDYDSQGNIIDYHASDSRFGDRFGSREVIATAIAYLKGRGWL